MESTARRLQVLPGGRVVSRRIGDVTVAVSREDDPPFGVDAEALEEDTWLALSTPADVVTPPGHPARVMTQVWDASPEPLGSVVARPGTPVRLLAVVHDLDAEPSCTPESLQSAISELLRLAEEHGFRALRLPILGCRHGTVPAEVFLDALRAELSTIEPDHPLRRVWIARGDERGEWVLDVLEAGAEAHDAN